MSTTTRAADLAPLTHVYLAMRPLLVDRVTAPRRDVHGVERVVVCGIDTVTGRNCAVFAEADTAVVVES